jgi:putative cell wall-binding protein
MKKAFLFVLIAIFSPSAIFGAALDYDVIVVRGDLPYDWTVAQAYSQRAQIPIITTSPDVLDESTREQLIGFKETGHNSVLVFGGEAAIFPSIEAEMVEEGFITHRIREVDRYGTSARVAVELYESAETVVIVNGEDVRGLLNSQMAALQTNSPILLIKRDEIPQSVKETLRLLGTKDVILIPSEVSENVRAELESGYNVELFSELTESSSSRNLRVFDIALGLILGASLSLLLKKRGRGKVPYNVLTDDEEQIVRAIEENGGELGQDALYKATDFSRPKISRVVSELVERDLIEKTQFKRTFKLKIKKELVKD